MPLSPSLILSSQSHSQVQSDYENTQKEEHGFLQTKEQPHDFSSMYLQFIYQCFLLQSETGELSKLGQHPLLF